MLTLVSNRYSAHVFLLLKMTSHVPVQKVPDCLASGIGTGSFLEKRSPKQLHTRHDCTFLGPLQYTRRV